MELCLAIVAAWQADGASYTLSEDLLAELRSHTYIQQKRMRPFLAAVNVLASDALFGGFQNRAINMMRLHGFADKKRAEHPKNSNTLVRKAAADHRLSSAYAEQFARRSWGTVKAVRSK